jgi:DNA (cytosine-5)-methyltransferase 1
MLGGPPCQGFSLAGKLEESDNRNKLVFSYLTIVEKIMPKAVVIENVPNILNFANGAFAKAIVKGLSEIGYNIEVFKINCSDFGVPQKRDRIYIVGFNKKKVRRADFHFPKPRTSKVGIGKFVESGIKDLSISKHLQSVYIYKLDDGRPEVITPKSDFPVKTLVASYHKIQRLTGTFVKDGPTGLRLLSENECKSIMGFPKGFKIPVSRTQMYRQFGNSVAVPVVKAVARSIVKHLEENSKRG